LTFKRFQALMSQKTNLPANQLSAVFVCRRMVRRCPALPPRAPGQGGGRQLRRPAPEGGPGPRLELTAGSCSLVTTGGGRGQAPEAAGEREHQLQHHPEPAQPQPRAGRPLPHLHQEKQEGPQGCVPSRPEPATWPTAQ
jgi:hypothetical protein